MQIPLTPPYHNNFSLPSNTPKNTYKKQFFKKIQPKSQQNPPPAAADFSKSYNIMFSRDDKFIGKFNLEEDIVIKREYLSHTPYLKVYHTRIHSKKQRPTCQLAIIHGWASSSNFIELGVKFAKEGMIVHLFDLQGFGYSGGLRRDARMRYFLHDLHKVLQCCYEYLPLFLYGHSMGALITIYYLLYNKIRVSGVILSSPLLQAPDDWDVTWTKEMILNMFGTFCDVILFVLTLFRNLL